MKIAIASDDGKTIAHHFGRAHGFVVFDIDDGEKRGQEYRLNDGRHKGICGSCDHAAMIDNIKDCSIVISYGMGRRIYDDLAQANIKAVVTDEREVDAALSRFLADDLSHHHEKLH